MQKGSDSVPGQPSANEKSMEHTVATVDIKETNEKEVQVQEQMATRKGTAAKKEKATKKPTTMETVRQKVRLTILISIL